MGKEWEEKARLMSWDKHSFTGQKGRGKKNNNDKRIQKMSDAQCYCSPPADQSPSSPPSFIVQHDATGCVMSLWPVRVSCSSCVPSQLPVPSASSLAGNEKLKSPWFHVSTAQQQLKPQCVINIILILNPTHSTVPATGKRINSIPA